MICNGGRWRPRRARSTCALLISLSRWKMINVLIDLSGSPDQICSRSLSFFFLKQRQRCWRCEGSWRMGRRRMCSWRSVLYSICSSSCHVVVTMADFFVGGALGVPCLSVRGENPRSDLRWFTWQCWLPSYFLVEGVVWILNLLRGEIPGSDHAG